MVHCVFYFKLHIFHNNQALYTFLACFKTSPLKPFGIFLILISLLPFKNGHRILKWCVSSLSSPKYHSIHILLPITLFSRYSSHFKKLRIATSLVMISQSLFATQPKFYFTIEYLTLNRLHTLIVKAKSDTYLC